MGHHLALGCPVMVLVAKVHVFVEKWVCPGISPVIWRGSSPKLRAKEALNSPLLLPEKSETELKGNGGHYHHHA